MMSTSSTTCYTFPTASTPSAHSMTSSSISSNTVNKGGFPKIILHLMEHGLMSADAQIERLLTNLKYPQNIYALKYILEHKGDSVSVDMLDTALKSLCSQEFDNVFSRESTIKLEWRLRIIIIILERMCQNECQFPGSFLDNIRQAISTYKNAHSLIMQHGAEGSNELNKAIKSFKCNYNSKYLLKLIKNML